MGRAYSSNPQNSSRLANRAAIPFYRARHTHELLGKGSVTGKIVLVAQKAIALLLKLMNGHRH
jgi:hypothetical protein